MPTNSPPQPEFPQSIFNALHAMTYDSGREAFLSDSTLYYLFAKQTSGSASAWFHATYSGGENCPLCKITSTAGNVIKNGTWNANGSVTYSGTTYWIVLYRASNGTLYAEATSP